MDRLLAPFSSSEFHDTYYEKQPLLIKRQSPAYYENLVTLDDINVHLGEGHLSSQALRIVRDGKVLDAGEFTYPDFSASSHGARDTVDKDALFAKFYEGYSIIIHEFERHSAPMLRLCHDLERSFHATVPAHVYLTPSNAQGFVAHWDTHDTLIMQFTGAKDWAVYDSPILLPTRQQPIYPDQWSRVEPTLTATLEPGDLLYIPRGFVHEARTRDTMSGHVTIGLQTHTYADLLRSIADNAHAVPWLRKSLPVDFQSVASNDEFLGHVHEFFDNADLSAYLERMHEDFAEGRLPDATNRLADYVNLPSISTGSRFRLRSVVCHELTNGGGQAVLMFHGKSLKFPAAAAESIRVMVGAREFEVRALPGNSEDNLAWCSRLVREGFLSIA
ncbi:MAG TPA: cupin domain-containing protein [Thermoanaerobaculia bacterium]